MSLDQRYPHLANFLGTWFPDADLEGKSDTEVARQFAESVRPEERKAAIKQGKDLLNSAPFPWKEISRESNRCFANAEEAKHWLSAVLEVVESPEARYAGKV